ncbi:hypothetical protein ACOXXX_07435 [Thalassococcus sp. BH17M4-6]|uniref:hypothetical protein n=1 Tax=Thalassococcus sp. BH17M4-6 TaxID=3413148 RepID=UPI003BDF33A7
MTDPLLVGDGPVVRQRGRLGKFTVARISAPPHDCGMTFGRRTSMQVVALCASLICLAILAPPAKAQQDPWQPTGPVFQIELKRGQDLLKRAYRKCPAGFHERQRIFNPKDQSQTVQFQCLSGLAVPRLPSVQQIGRISGKPLFRVACAKAGDCFVMAGQACSGGIDILDYGTPVSKGGMYYAQALKVGNRWREATFYSFVCD